MEELQHLSSERGIYGKILYYVRFFAIVVEECDDFKLGDYQYGHVYIVYILHEGTDYRTHMVKTKEEVTQCVEKLKKEILTISHIIQQESEKTLEIWAKGNEAFDSLYQNIIGTNTRRFGGGFPVYMEDYENGSYVVFESNFNEDIAFDIYKFDKESEAIAYARYLSRNKAFKYYMHFYWGELESDKIFGIIIKEYQNNWYLLQDEAGRICSYHLKIDQKDSKFPSTEVEDFDDIQSAEKYIYSSIAKEQKSNS